MRVIRPLWSTFAARTVELALGAAVLVVRATLAVLAVATSVLEALSQRLEGRRVAAALLAARSAKAANRWRVAFEAAPIAMARVSLEGRIEAVNSSLCNLLGEPERALTGRRLSGLVYPDDLETLAGPGNPGRTRGVAKAEVRLVCAGGRLRWCELASTLVQDLHGRPDHVLAYVVDITRHKQSQAALRDLATRDPLSGLANRRWFELQLAHHLRTCAEDGPRGALLVMDLDNFKSVNDTLGHQAGDRLVIEAAVTLRRHLRDHDLVARLGGDEFAVILRDGDSSAAEAVARKLVLAVRDEVFAPLDEATVGVAGGAEGEQGGGAGPAPQGLAGIGGASPGATRAGTAATTPPPTTPSPVAASPVAVAAGASGPELQKVPEVTVSVGVAPFELLAGATPKDAIKAADSAMYTVKRSGRNGYAVAGAPEGPHHARPRSSVPDLSADAYKSGKPLVSSGAPRP